ncbi:hypothetical protein AcW1_004632 [Taiwanofungus camphoratus]|nr:hypothetical protein AcV5_001017 [Antrodia cinnamomea]KAI0959966.1 hypothetical protein AcW1_004632 [Antrodia cinnamomea]
MSTMNYNRDVDSSELDIGNLANGIFGGSNDADGSSTNDDPFGLGGLTSILSPIVPPFGQSTLSPTLTLSSSSSSTTPTLTSGSSAPPTTSQASSNAASSTPTADTPSSSATSSSDSALSSGPASTFSITTSTPKPIPSDTSIPFPSSASSSALSSSSPSASATAAPASSSNSFLQNKALSVGVIVSASLVGLVLFIVIATFAIRRRRRNKLHDEAIDFRPDSSSEQLVINSTADVEKGADPGIPGAGRRSSGGSMGGETSRVGSAEALASGLAGSGAGTGRSRDMYERTGYPALPVFVPEPAPTHSNYSTPQNTYTAQGYSAQGQNQAYPDPGPYPSFTPLSNPFDPPLQPNIPVVASTGPLNGLYPRAVAQRPAQRKQAPALLPLNIASMSPPVYSGPVPDPSPQSAVSLTASPMQPASTMNPANPPPIKRSSLLNSPPKTPSPSNQSADSPWDMRPQFPATAPLPDEFGRSVPIVNSDEKRGSRKLTVRNN